MLLKFNMDILNITPKKLKQIFSFVASEVTYGLQHSLDTFVVKDVIDIANIPTSASNPTWLQTHPIPEQSAPAVQTLLDNGIKFLGKTHSDELGFSMFGKNVHYGTPLNPATPTCFPGGSSSGSASAVALGVSTIALAADTGGSIRAPASMCGLIGFRPTHGRINVAGSIPISPMFDTLGVLAKDPLMLKKYGAELLNRQKQRPFLERF